MGARQLICEAVNQNSPYLEPPGMGGPPDDPLEGHAEHIDDRAYEIFSEKWVQEELAKLIPTVNDDNFEEAIDSFIDREIAPNFKSEFDPPDPEDCPRNIPNSMWRAWEEAWGNVRSTLYELIAKSIREAGAVTV